MQTTEPTFSPSSPIGRTDQKAPHILARSIFEELRHYGARPDEVLDVASELIGLVTADLATDQEASSAKDIS